MPSYYEPLSMCLGKKAMVHRAPASSAFCLLSLSPVTCGESPSAPLISCGYVHFHFEVPVSPVLHSPDCITSLNSSISCICSGAQYPKAWRSFGLDIPQTIMTDKAFVTRRAGFSLPPYFALNIERIFLKQSFNVTFQTNH